MRGGERLYSLLPPIAHRPEKSESGRLCYQPGVKLRPNTAPVSSRESGKAM